MRPTFFKRLLPKRPGWQVGAALTFIAAGFIVIWKAWDGAASIDFAQGQIPYLLSGGAAGMGLIIVGTALMIFEVARRDRLHLDQRLERIAKLLEEMQPSPNGTSTLQPEPGLVIAGASSYHTPECRLVAGKQELIFLTIDEAGERGLTACRVCRPATVPG